MSEDRTPSGGALGRVVRLVRLVPGLAWDGARVVGRAPRSVFKRAEERRLRTGIRGDSVASVSLPDGSFSGLAVYHLDFLDVILRLAASIVMFVFVLTLPPPLAAAVVVLGHLLSLFYRKAIPATWAWRLAVVEAVLFVLVWQLAGDLVLWSVLVLAVVGGFFYSLASWWLDMQVGTVGGKLHRLSGILWWKHTTTVSLSKVTLSEAHEVAFGRGFVSFDTASSQDGRLHGWGMVRHPALWIGVIAHLTDSPPPVPVEVVKGGDSD